MVEPIDLATMYEDLAETLGRQSGPLARAARAFLAGDIGVEAFRREVVEAEPTEGSTSLFDTLTLEDLYAMAGTDLPEPVTVTIEDLHLDPEVEDLLLERGIIGRDEEIDTSMGALQAELADVPPPEG